MPDGFFSSCFLCVFELFALLLHSGITLHFLHFLHYLALFAFFALPCLLYNNTTHICRYVDMGFSPKLSGYLVSKSTVTRFQAQVSWEMDFCNWQWQFLFFFIMFFCLTRLAGNDDDDGERERQRRG